MISDRKIIGLISGTELLGSERGNIEALSALKSLGAEIHVGVSSREGVGGPVELECRNRGFHIFHLPYGSHFAWKWMTKDLAFAKRQFQRLWTNSQILSKHIKKIQPTHLIIGNTLAYTFTMIALAKHRRTNLIYRAGDEPVTSSALQMWIWRRLVHRANHIVCISNYIQKTLSAANVPKNKTTVIYNRPPHRTGPVNSKFIQYLIKQKKQLQIVYVGQISSNKGVPQLIDALINLNDNSIGAYIIGGSSHTRKLETLLQKKINSSQTSTRIDWIGYIEDPRPYYYVADWHIAPTQKIEALGNVVYESKAMGTPSIVTAVGGLPETVRHEQTGIIMNGHSTHHIQKTIQLIQSDQTSTTQYKQAALKEHEQLHEKFGSAWQDVLQNASLHS